MFLVGYASSLVIALILSMFYLSLAVKHVTELCSVTKTATTISLKQTSSIHLDDINYHIEDGILDQDEWLIEPSLHNIVIQLFKVDSTPSLSHDNWFFSRPPPYSFLSFLP